MSSDAKIWQDKDGWHGICDDVPGEQFNETNYGLRDIIVEIEGEMKQSLHWEIFQFDNGLGLRGYRAK